MKYKNSDPKNEFVKQYAINYLSCLNLTKKISPRNRVIPTCQNMRLVFYLFTVGCLCLFCEFYGHFIRNIGATVISNTTIDTSAAMKEVWIGITSLLLLHEHFYNNILYYYYAFLDQCRFNVCKHTFVCITIKIVKCQPLYFYIAPLI